MNAAKIMIKSGALYHWRPFSKGLLRDFFDYVRECLIRAALFDKSDFPPPDVNKFHLSILNNFSKIAGKSKFWKERLQKCGLSDGIGSLEKFGWLPVLTKSEIAARNLADFFPDNLRAGEAYLIFTSGTTGNKTKFLRDRNSHAIWQACFRNALRRAGLADDQKTAVLNMRQRWFDGLGVHVHVDDKSIFGLDSVFSKYEINGLFADADILAEVGRYLYQLNKKIKLKSVLYSGRRLFPREKDIIRAAFGCDVFSVYGTSESGIIASECGSHNGLHVNAIRVYLEIADDGGKSLPPGRIGNIIVTPFDNPAMALIRYSVGDFGRIDVGTCSCGEKTTRLFVDDRIANKIFLPRQIIHKTDTSFLSFYELGEIIVNHREVEGFFVRQREDYSLEIMVSPVNLNPGAEEALARSVALFLKDDLKFRLITTNLPSFRFNFGAKTRFFSGIGSV